MTAKRGPGRPRVTDTVVKVGMTEDVVAKLDRMAQAQQISRAEVIRRLIARRI